MSSGEKKKKRPAQIANNILGVRIIYFSVLYVGIYMILSIEKYYL